MLSEFHKKRDGMVPKIMSKNQKEMLSHWEILSSPFPNLDLIRIYWIS